MQKIGILAAPRPERGPKGFKLYGESESFYKETIKAGQKMGIQVYIFSDKDINFKTGKVQAKTPYRGGWKETEEDLPLSIYNRLLGTSYPRSTLKKIEKKGITLRNPDEILWLACDKLKVSKIFSQNKIPQARSYPYSNKKMLTLLEKGPVYLKPRNGSQGRGILKINKAGEKYKMSGKGRKLTRRELLKELTSKIHENYLLQEEISCKKYKGSVYDIRALLQRDEHGKVLLTGFAARVGKKGSVLSNIHKGGKARRAKEILQELYPEKWKNIEEDIRKQARASYTALQKAVGEKGILELGIDLLLDKEGRVYVDEINSRPGRQVLRIFKDKDGKNTYREKAIQRPLAYLLYLSKQKKYKR